MDRGENLMKRRSIPAEKRVDRSVAWWWAVLLAALIAVLIALFLSARLVLSLDDHSFDQAKSPHDWSAGVVLVLLGRDESRRHKVLY